LIRGSLMWFSLSCPSGSTTSGREKLLATVVREEL